MSQHLSVHLSDKDRQHLDGLLKKGNAPARVQTRARILLLADRSQAHKRTGQQIAEAALCCRLTVSQICRRFALEGLESALYERSRDQDKPPRSPARSKRNWLWWLVRLPHRGTSTGR